MRPVLQVSDKKTSEGEQQKQTQKPSTPSVYDRRQLLKVVENLYLLVLSLEQMRRQGKPEPKPGYEDEHEDAAQEWEVGYAEKVQRLWDALKVVDSTER